MQSLLDNKDWYLDSLDYRDALHLVLVEAKAGPKLTEESLKNESSEALKKVLLGSTPMEVHEDSEYVRIIFKKVVAWQMVDESYTAWDDYEVRDDKNYLQVLSRSRYLDFVNQHHGWYSDIAGPAQHYRIWTQDEVIDVVSHDLPTIKSDERNPD